MIITRGDPIHGQTLATAAATVGSDFAAWGQLMRGSDIASAGTITIPAVGEYFRVSGTTTINFITVDATMLAGRPFVLGFTGVLTVGNNTGSPPGGTAPILLTAGANLTTIAGSSSVDGSKLVLRYDDAVAKFVEVGNAAAASGGTVTSVNPGTGITITGTSAAPIVNNAGVLSVTAGTRRRRVIARS